MSQVVRSQIAANALKIPSLPPSLSGLVEAVERQAWKTKPDLPRALTEAERSTLSEIANKASQAALAVPCEASAMREVVRLLMAFPSQSMTDAKAASMAAAYATALDGVPTWAIEAASACWLRGEHPGLDGSVNLAFAPSPPQLAIMAREQFTRARAAKYRAEQLLNGMPPEPRKAVDPARLVDIRKRFGI